MSLLASGNKGGLSSVPSRMRSNVPISRGRRLAGSAALIGTAGGLAATALHDLRWIEWSVLAFAGLVGVAGVGLARRGMVAQTLSRATAWVVFAPCALVTLVSLNGHSPELGAIALAAGSGAALLLARPMLHTEEARAEFAPTSYRSWLMAGATAAAATGLVTGMLGFDVLRTHLPTGLAFGMLGLSLVASAIGVVRMRAWGILLGALTSIVTLVSAAFMHGAAGLAVSLTAVPGLMLLLPVLLAQRDRRRAKAASSSFSRIATSSASDLPVRFRVAPDVASGHIDDDDAADDLVAKAPAPRTMHV